MPTKHKAVIKNRTLGGDLCHTYFELELKDVPFLYIRRVILSKDESYWKYANWLRLVGDYDVYEQTIVLKLDTLNELNKWIETLTK